MKKTIPPLHRDLIKAIKKTKNEVNKAVGVIKWHI